MAIKTKKISDLNVISKDLLIKSSLLGTQGGMTGQIKFEDLMEKVDERIDTKIASQPSTISTAAVEEVSVSNEDVENLKSRVETLKGEISDVSSAYKTLNKKYNSYVKSTSETILTLQNTIGELSATVEGLVSFVQALQKDGYLTLAEIRKAAADACPICNHTHEEETTTEE